MMYIACSLLAGWILSLFGFDALFISGLGELFNLTITTTGYYTIFALIGIVGWVGRLIRGSRNNED